MSSDSYHALRRSVEVPFFRKSHDLLDGGKIKTPQSRPVFEVFRPNNLPIQLFQDSDNPGTFWMLPLPPKSEIEWRS